MFFPYCTIGNDVEVTQTRLNKNNQTVVHIEIPDEKLGFKVAECYVPSYQLSNVYGMTDKDIKEFLKFCHNNAHLLIEYARIGGVANA